MRLITFLGTGGYQKVTYSLEGKSYVTAFFPVALVHCIQNEPKSVLCFVTEASSKQFKDLKQEINSSKSDIDVTSINIPNGSNEQEQWEIFKIVTNSLESKEEVYFDITHGFRTIPLLTFLAASYLRVAKDIKLNGIYYGAYEARQITGARYFPASDAKGDPTYDPSQECAPIFNLTSFLNLLEWTNATEQFLTTGDARRLAKLIKNYSLLSPASKTELKSLADAFEAFSISMELSLSNEVTYKSQELITALNNLEKDVTESKFPLLPLIERIKVDIRPLCNGKDDNQLEVLKAQYEAILWHFKRTNYIQAITMSQEWIISAFAYKLNVPSSDFILRECIRWKINAPGYPLSNKNYPSNIAKDFDNIPDHIIQNLNAMPTLPEGFIRWIQYQWEPLKKVRNFLNHAGATENEQIEDFTINSTNARDKVNRVKMSMLAFYQLMDLK